MSRIESKPHYLLPDRDGIEVVLPSVISIKQVAESWGEERIELTARAVYAMRKIVPASTENVKDTISIVESICEIGYLLTNASNLHLGYGSLNCGESIVPDEDAAA